MSFLNQLKTRGVTRVILAYLAVAWLVLQAAEMLLPVYGFGDAAIRNVVVILGAGFLVAVAFSWFFEWTAGGIVREDSLETADTNTAGEPGRSHPHMNRFTVLVLSLAVAFFVVDKFILEPERDLAREQVVAEQARVDALTGSSGEHSIAVLPFRDLSPEGDQEYLSAGVAEELLNLLNRIPELRVSGRASSFSFAGQAVPIPEIGQRLNVGYILDGSVSKSGDRVRVTAQLIDATTDTQLWAGKYDRQLDDIFAVQDDIAAQVVSGLRLLILGEIPTVVAIAPEAFEKFLKARFIMHEFDTDRIEEADALLQEVLAMEPDYLPALSLSLYTLWHKRQTASPEMLESEVRGLYARMNAVDPNSADTLRVKADISRMYDQDPQAAIDALEQALSAEPGNIEVLRGAVYWLIDLEQYDDAIKVAKNLVLREPSCGRCVNVLGNAFRGSKRQAEGAEYLTNMQQWHSVPPGYYWNLGVLWLGAGEPQKALDTWEMEEQDVGELWRLLALHDLGRTQEFESLFAAMRADPEQHPESIARVYAYAGNADKAFEWLARMFDPASEVEQVWVLYSEIYDPIKSDPRWEKMTLEGYGMSPEDEPAWQDLHFDLPPGLFAGS